jgi:hypothetical protein
MEAHGHLLAEEYYGGIVGRWRAVLTQILGPLPQASSETKWHISFFRQISIMDSFATP